MSAAVAQPSSASRRGPLAALERRWGLLLCSPYILGILVFSLGPILFSWMLGFFHWDNLSTPRFTGLENWRRLASDELFWKALRNTTLYVVGSVPSGVALSLLLAVLVNRPLRGIAFFRTTYFLPVVTSTVAVALVWSWFYDANYGILNYFLTKGGDLVGLKLQSHAWLNDPATAMPAIIVMSVWKGLGYNMVILLAALQGVPRELYEAAGLDGAGPVRKFIHVTVPCISPVLFFVVIVALIGSFQVFDQVYVMTRDGRPADSTLTIVYLLYRHAFQYLDMGYASVIGATLFLITLAITAVQLAGQKRWVTT